MDEQLASRAYQVLIDECGAAADAYSRAAFIANHRDGRVDEYRFMGSLGFGGKFWQRDMRVSCYREDETPARLAMIERANARLSELAGLHQNGAPMSRQRDRITRAVESRGYKVQSMRWEPIYYAGEKSGLGGGWSVVTDRPYHSLGYQELNALSTEELLAELDYWLKPVEPCGCDSVHHPGHPLKGDPDSPVHRADCRHHIRYRLGWWKAA